MCDKPAGVGLIFATGSDVSPCRADVVRCDAKAGRAERSDLVTDVRSPTGDVGPGSASMDDRRFDWLAKGVAEGRSRRSLLKTLLGVGAGVAVGVPVLGETDAARRGFSGPTAPTAVPTQVPPTPTPVPPTPTPQPPLGCASGSTACGSECCDDVTSMCCDSACCVGYCYGEELCCPTPREYCAENNTCCAAGEKCCINGYCYSTASGAVLPGLRMPEWREVLRGPNVPFEGRTPAAAISIARADTFAPRTTPAARRPVRLALRRLTAAAGSVPARTAMLSTEWHLRQSVRGGIALLRGAGLRLVLGGCGCEQRLLRR